MTDGQVLNVDRAGEAPQAVAEALYRKLVALLPAAVYTCDARGIITYFNRRAAELWGREPRLGDTDQRFCGSYRLYYPGGTPLPHDQTPMAQALRTGQSARDKEVVIERPDGSIITVLVNIEPIFDEQGQISGAVNVFQDISPRVRLRQEREQLLVDLKAERARLKELAESLEERVQKRTVQVRDLAAALSLAEQRERTHLSQILHDDLQQLLYSQLIRLELLRQKLATLPSEAEADLAGLVAGMMEQMEQAVRLTRGLAAELNPPQMEDADLGQALEWLAGHMKEAYGLTVRLTSNGASETTQGETRDLLLQMVRELLFNVVKHSGTSEAQVKVSQEDGILAIRVEDGGIGLDVDEMHAAPDAAGAIGLHSISERLSLIGGHLAIEAAPGAGTRVTIFAPVTSKQ